MRKFRTAAYVAGVAFISAVPYTRHVAGVAVANEIRSVTRGRSIDDLVRFDLLSLAAIVVIAALVGAFASERYGLRGIGDLEDVKKVLPFAFTIGTAFSVG